MKHISREKIKREVNKMASTGISKPAGSSGQFGGGGSGRFRPMRRKQRGNSSNPFAQPRFDRMSFKASKDPVYVAFDHLDKQPVSKLAKDFVKETFAIPFTKWISQGAA